MLSQYDFLKSIHPDQFSDTLESKYIIEEKYMHFILDTLGENKLENEFEVFCRLLCQIVIAPNLTVQTGSTGGGDRKTDTETYPVSKDNAFRWFESSNIDSSDQRWAFAYSTQKSWKTKVKKDFNSIIGTGRSYRKVFFVSSRYIRDKGKAEIEDEYTKESCQYVILDKLWIVENIIKFDLYKEFHDTFELGEPLVEESKTGVNDYKRINHMEEIEKQLQEITVTDHVEEVAELIFNKAILLRELESSKEKVTNIFERLLSLIREHKLYQMEYDVMYEYARTCYWWYEDLDSYVAIYSEFIDKDLSNLFNLNSAYNLWLNINTEVSKGSIENVFMTPSKLIDAYKDVILDKDRISATLEAEARLVLIDFHLSHNYDNLVRELIEIFNKSDGNHVFNFELYVRIVRDMGDLLKKADNYFELVDLIAKKIGIRNSEIQSAKYILEISESNIEDNPHETFIVLGRIVTKLFKYETKREFQKATYLMGIACRNRGMIWLSIKYLMTFVQTSLDESTRIPINNKMLLMAIHELVLIEVQNNRILHSLSWWDLLIFSNKIIYSSKYDMQISEWQSMYEGLLAISIIKEKKMIKEISQLKYLFDKNDFFVPALTARYVTGINDVGKKYNLSVNEVQNLMEGLVTQTFVQQLKNPMNLGLFDGSCLNTVIMGSKIKIAYAKNIVAMIFAEILVTSLESFFFNTIKQRSVFSVFEEITINVNYRKSNESKIKVSNSKRKNVINFQFSLKSIDSFGIESELVFNTLLELYLVMIRDCFKVTNFESIKRDFVRNNLVERTIAFSSPVASYKYLFGDIDFLPKLSGKRDINVEIRNNRMQTLNFINEKVIEGESNDFDLENIRHSDIRVASIIDMDLWDRAKWDGVSYLLDFKQKIMVMCLLFRNLDFGEKIFESWISKFGIKDQNNDIELTIIKDIDDENPLNYNVVLGANMLEIAKREKVSYMQNLQRFKTLEPSGTDNLGSFIKMVKRIDKEYSIGIMPIDIKTYMKYHGNKSNIIDTKYMILKKDFRVLSARDIDDNHEMHGVKYPAYNLPKK